ncbi:U24-ctenitoxin-Pn1a-like [Centruroides sculpturatus]|uniref:U24-ctenitoxin-Pn1a-like n=1 Tax=Centruroides sculpturatus TaxID=218467 RepID=UPI000C6C9E9C|nr:U24-ctenitoxin-Pn1a-like [Centruroides sculpturatus]
MKTLLKIVVLSATIAVSLGYSRCIRSRQHNLRQANPFVIHQCDENGDYLPLQQTVGTPHWRWCFNKNGNVLMGPSRKIETCVCFVKMFASQEAGERVPRCDRKGYFYVVQKDGTNEWCVDKNTGEKTSSLRPINSEIICN